MIGTGSLQNRLFVAFITSHLDLEFNSSSKPLTEL